MSIKELIRIAEKIEKKLSFGQIASAQAGDIENALTAAKLNNTDIVGQVSALLNTAGVPENCSVDINLTFDRTLTPIFNVNLTPNHGSSIVLARLLKNTYGARMRAALTAAKLTIADKVEMKQPWMHF